MTYHTHKLTHTFVIVDASTDVASLDAGGEEIFDARDTKDAADYVAGVMAYEAGQVDFPVKWKAVLFNEQRSVVGMIYYSSPR